ncbi:MAG: alanyl-tRNA editing protein [Christensenellales bacterium]|jgi:alanyl-tRNA synthetase
MEFLYHNDSYMREFDAVVTEVSQREEGFAVTLSRSAFYYTSGGQPHDTGTLGGAKVLDVFKEGEKILHIVDSPLKEGDAVRGEIDWQRRFDHMCQHAGEHMIAWAIRQKFGGTTIGLHLGAQVSTIDVDMHGAPMKLSPQDISDIENMVMEKILANLPIDCWFPSPEELETLPLRKKPTVNENVRVVGIGGFEYVACGGTHPRSTGEIGMVKIVDARPNRGKLRVSFFCGMRAFRAFQLLQRQADEACALLSASWENLSENVSLALERQRQAEGELLALQIRSLLSREEELLSKARLCAEGRAVFASFDMAGEEAIRALASKLAEQGDVIALVFSKEEGKISAVLARGGDIPVHMGNLLREVFSGHGGKGGGRPEFAMGSLPQDADMDALRAGLMAALS